MVTSIVSTSTLEQQMELEINKYKHNQTALNLQYLYVFYIHEMLHRTEQGLNCPTPIVFQWLHVESNKDHQTVILQIKKQQNIKIEKFHVNQVESLHYLNRHAFHFKTVVYIWEFDFPDTVVVLDKGQISLLVFRHTRKVGWGLWNRRQCHLSIRMNLVPFCR